MTHSTSSLTRFMLLAVLIVGTDASESDDCYIDCVYFDSITAVTNANKTLNLVPFASAPVFSTLLHVCLEMQS